MRNGYLAEAIADLELAEALKPGDAHYDEPVPDTDVMIATDARHASPHTFRPKNDG